jgi:hypothetical protein
MKTYMAVFTGSPAAMDAWKGLDEDERNRREKAGMEAWMAWGEKHAAAIVDHGSPLGKTLRVDKDGTRADRNNLAAWTVVRAESQEAAAALFEGHPHFTIFPGDGVEVMECLPMPEMPKK